jgi:hypothetical protein
MGRHNGSPSFSELAMSQNIWFKVFVANFPIKSEIYKRVVRHDEQKKAAEQRLSDGRTLPVIRWYSTLKVGTMANSPSNSGDSRSTLVLRIIGGERWWRVRRNLRCARPSGTKSYQTDIPFFCPTEPN